MLQLIFLLTCPLLVAVAVALVAWGALASPWKFLLIAIAALYALYMLLFYLLGPASVGFAVHGLEPGQPKSKEPFLLYLEPYYKPLSVFALLAVPTVLVLLKTFKR